MSGFLSPSGAVLGVFPTSGFPTPRMRAFFDGGLPWVDTEGRRRKRTCLLLFIYASRATQCAGSSSPVDGPAGRTSWSWRSRSGSRRCCRSAWSWRKRCCCSPWCHTAHRWLEMGVVGNKYMAIDTHTLIMVHFLPVATYDHICLFFHISLFFKPSGVTI